jgi:hypothetical protein
MGVARVLDVGHRVVTEGLLGMLTPGPRGGACVRRAAAEEEGGELEAGVRRLAPYFLVLSLCYMAPWTVLGASASPIRADRPRWQPIAGSRHA